jgi:hypothetical protein
LVWVVGSCRNKCREANHADILAPIADNVAKTVGYYPTTGFATTLAETARKATRSMVDYLS